jgi:osmotically-inducible protein OsmY
MALAHSKSSKGSSARAVAIGTVVGAGGAYLFDPQSGRRRRSLARDRIAAIARRGTSKSTEAVERSAQRAADEARGLAAEARRSVWGERPAPNDQALADRVKSEIFRDADVPKGSISINAEAGIVYLRGEADEKQAEALVAATKEVEGVRGVENLLHGPGEPAPHKSETEEETRLRVEGA